MSDNTSGCGNGSMCVKVRDQQYQSHRSLVIGVHISGSYSATGDADRACEHRPQLLPLHSPVGLLGPIAS